MCLTKQPIINPYVVTYFTVMLQDVVKTNQICSKCLNSFLKYDCLSFVLEQSMRLLKWFITDLFFSRGKEKKN